MKKLPCGRHATPCSLILKRVAFGCIMAACVCDDADVLRRSSPLRSLDLCARDDVDVLMTSKANSAARVGFVYHQ